VIERVSSMPDVRAAALTITPPPFGGMRSGLEIPGMALPPEASTAATFCSDRLIETIGLPLVRGRQLSALDVEKSHHVALISETFAKKYFGADEPLGRTIRLPRLSTLPVPVADPTFEIVGVVGDMANEGPREAPTPQVFLPFTVVSLPGLGLVMRTSGDPLRIVGPLRREIQAINRDVAVVEPLPMETFVQNQFYARPRFSLLVLGIFACTGIVLVAFGVYGVLAYTVSQQTKEIAIRMALGGERGHVIRMVLRLGMQLVGVGLIIGVAASLGTNRLLVSQLWNTSPADPTTFAVVISAIVAIGVFACWIPARRAVRVEPMVALRHE
jgi:putative ABC transport system permease protein